MLANTKSKTLFLLNSFQPATRFQQLKWLKNGAHILSLSLCINCCCVDAECFCYQAQIKSRVGRLVASRLNPPTIRPRAAREIECLHGTPIFSLSLCSIQIAFQSRASLANSIHHIESISRTSQCHHLRR